MIVELEAKSGHHRGVLLRLSSLSVLLRWLERVLSLFRKMNNIYFCGAASGETTYESKIANHGRSIGCRNETFNHSDAFEKITVKECLTMPADVKRPFYNHFLKISMTLSSIFSKQELWLSPARTLVAS